MKQRTVESGARQRGFAALMSVVVLAGMLMMVTYTVSTTSFFARFDALDGERKRVSLALADGCVVMAAARLADDDEYEPAPGGECVSLGGECGELRTLRTCKICAVAQADEADERTVVVRAVHDGAYTNIRVVLVRDGDAYSVRTWSEIPRYDGQNCPL